VTEADMKALREQAEAGDHNARVLLRHIQKVKMAQRAARRAALLERYCAGDAREER